MTRFFPFAVVALLTVLLGAALLRGEKPLSPLVGKSAPALPLAVKGPYAVNFFASWCGPCRAEQPVLLRIAKSGLSVYGVAYKDDPAAMHKFLQETGNPFAAVARDPEGRVALDWGTTGVPETFVIDAHGIVRARHAGPVTEKDIDAILTEARR